MSPCGLHCLTGTKKPAQSSDKSPERLGLNSPFHIPSEEVCDLRSASNHSRSRLDAWGGLGTDKYHTKKVCQNGLFRQRGQPYHSIQLMCSLAEARNSIILIFARSRRRNLATSLTL